MHPTLKAYFTIYILVLTHFIPASGQSKSWRQYTTNDGLPSNEVYEIMQDSRGYIWFATDQGICRFNGYEFFRPVDTSATRGTSAFIPTEDQEGRIWFARIDRSLWFIRNDTIIGWKYNALLDKYRGYNIDQLAIEKNGTVWLSLLALGFLVVNPDGKDSLLRVSNNNNFLFTRIRDKIIFNLQRATPIHEKEIHNPVYKTDILLLQGQGTTLIDKVLGEKIPTSFVRGIWPLQNGGFIHDHGGSIYHILDNRIQWSVKTSFLAEKMVETSDGSLLFACPHGDNPGLFHTTSLNHLRRAEVTNLLPGQFVSYALCDREGGWWASTKNAGVFYCENPDLDIFGTSSDLPSNDIVRLTSDGIQTIYAGLRPSAVYAIDRKNGMCTNLRIPDGILEIWALYYDISSDRLWCSPMLHYLDKGMQWKIGIYTDTINHIQSSVAGKKIVIDPSSHVMYASTHSGFHKIDLDHQTTELLGENDQNFDRTFSVSPDIHEKIWVITNDGLKQWIDNQYKSPPFSHPTLRFQPRDLEVLPNGVMAIGLRADGLLLKDSLDQFIHRTTDDGLTSNYITKLAASADGEIFACTNEGLNCLQKKGDSWEIETITVKQGLPSNQVNDATSLGGEIWVATDKGLAHFKTIPTPFPMPRPVIEQIKINSSEAMDISAVDLRHSQNNMSIRFYALHYRSGGDILYRYRLHGGDSTFIETKTRDVNFVQLAPGEYTFEVQAQNTDGKWSASTTKAFTIHPARWQTWWFRGVLILLLLSGLWFFYRRRLRSARQKLEIQNKIHDLESAALRAQMNPHFIFNCLVSIQQFIAENDADSASAYLAKFAKLVRLALHSSVDGRHSLREEIEMLENYLALEQMRFKNRFTYRINVSADLNTDEISLPPILIQPFVENAIVHGMKNKTADGRIDIGFSKHQNTLAVTVADNGPGITNTHQLTTETGHKSIGMTLTQRRLDILSGQSNDGKVIHENVMDEQGVVIGAKVTLEIPAEQT